MVALRRFVVLVLILGLGRVPLPMPDYHEFEHLEAAGLPCPNHAHLLRHHPEEPTRPGPALHWHWVLLNSAELCGEPSEDGLESPECHPDYSACEHDASPQFVAGKAVRRLSAQPWRSPSTDPPGHLAGWSWAPARPAPALRPRSFVATYPPRTSTASLLQRWTC